jgi:hypothetical protein
MTQVSEKHSVDEQGDDEQRVESEHLTDVPDGAGCTEIWEYLSETRNGDT